jgi:AraC-like DNA-binding protein
VYGFIRTGQVFRRAPTLEGFERLRQRLARWNVTLDAAKLREAYFATRVMAPALYHSAVGLLNLMGRHLSLLSNQLLLQRTSGESPMIAAAKKFIDANCHEPLTLRRVAEAVHTSRFNFSKQFKLVTGINFVRYVARLRVEKAKSLLLNPHYRVSEVAYAVGFGSSSHFNRMFERFAGLSPTDFRAQLAESQKTRKRDRCVARSLAPGPIGPRPPPAALNAFNPAPDSTATGRDREGERVPLVSSKIF